MEKYLKAITIVFFIIGLFGVVTGTIVLLYFKTSLLAGSWLADFITEKGIIEAEAVRKLIIYVPMLLASVGLYFKQKWGRIIALLWSVLNIADFPIGTVFGIIALWVLLKKETRKIFNIDESKFI